MLYGMGDPLKSAMIGLGQCVRVYCPYGDLMPGMGYLIRRLLENTSNEGFLKQSFSDRFTHDRHAALAFFFAADVGFVHFDRSAELG